MRNDRADRWGRKRVLTVTIVGYTLFTLLSGLALGPITALTPGVPEWIGNVGGNIGILAVPVCVAVAVLRYRLYDLGRLVSRTVSYVVITALLLAVYPANLKMAADLKDSRRTGLKTAAFARLPLQIPMVRAALRAARG